MRTPSLRNTAGALAFGCAACLAVLTVEAQPLYDRIHVNLPYTVTMQNKTLQPGDYTIQQMPSTTDSRILLFYSKDGMKFETSAMTIPTLDNQTPSDTKLVLNHVGDDYYISKIWVQGKDYGYELPVPDSIKSRQNERVTESTVSGTYQPSSSTEMTTTAQATAATEKNTQPPEPAPAAQPAPQPEPQPVTQPETQPATQAAAQPQPQPAPQPAANDNTADRDMTDQARATTSTSGSANREEMPSTAAGWLTMLLTGGTLSGAGLMLRRKR
jgi:hypothetical protein